MRFRPAAMLATLAALTVSPATGQVSIGAGGQYLSLGGTDFEGTDAGLGAEGNVLFRVGPAARLGASVLYSTHDDPTLPNGVNILGAFAEGRYVIGTNPGRLRPYIAGRAGWVRAVAPDATSGPAPPGGGSASTADLSATGFGIGAGAGLLIGISRSIALDVSGLLHSLSLGDAKSGGDPIAGSAQSGTALEVRAGLAFTLGAR